MRSDESGLSAEAQEALWRQVWASYRRSFYISAGFALPYSIIQSFLSFGVPFPVAFLSFSIPMGLAMPFIHLTLLERMRHRSFVVTLLRQTLLYMATILACLLVSLFAVISYKVIERGDPFVDSFHHLWNVITYPLFLLSLPAALLMVLPVRFMFAMSQKLGPGVLGKWMRGYYREPRQEERIFMFLDMKDSTTLAEKLGSLEFSALVRDFFENLTVPVLQTKCEVSHYIGDEAVLTWTMPNGLQRANCLRIFFEFEKAIERRSAYYVRRYGLVPEFKAGVHCGTVVATEVGEVKSEIVFHGDALNTAARIQGLCNELGERLLVSNDLFTKLDLPSHLVEMHLGEYDLKGKEERVAIVAISDLSEAHEKLDSNADGKEEARE